MVAVTHIFASLLVIALIRRARFPSDTKKSLRQNLYQNVVHWPHKPKSGRRSGEGFLSHFLSVKQSENDKKLGVLSGSGILI